MIAEAVRRSPLAEYVDKFAALSADSRGDLSIREVPFVSQLNLRADPKDAVLIQSFAAVLGFELPAVPNTVASREGRRALWLSPDEWLVVGPEGQQGVIEQELRNGLNGAFSSIVDVSANRTVLELRGAKARNVLAHGVPLDLDARSFSSGQCAQTVLSKAQVIIECRDEADLQVYVRASFATYIADWLLDAAVQADRQG